MKIFGELELCIAALGVSLGVVGYLTHSTTLEFLAVVDAAFGTALVVARVLGP